MTGLLRYFLLDQNTPILHHTETNCLHSLSRTVIFLFSRRVNPDPDVDNDALEEEEDMCPPLLQRDLKNSIDLNNSTSKLPLKGEGGLSKFGRKNLSSITLHSKVFDLTFDK